MKLVHKLQKMTVAFVLSATLSVLMAIGFGVNSSFAAPFPGATIGLAQPQLAIMNPVQAAAKDIEGKTQEAIGDMTKNPKDQLIGKAKQAQSEANRVASDTEASLKKSEAGKKVAKVTKDIKKAVKR